MYIIVSGSKNAAHVSRHAHDLGTHEPGKLADMVILENNPLEDPSAFRKLYMIIKDGKIVQISSAVTKSLRIKEPSYPEAKGKHAADAGPGGDADRAVVKLHDLPGQAEADARPSLLGRKEGDEDLVQILLGNADPVVPDLDDRPSALVEIRAEFDPGVLVSPDRFGGVEEKIDQDLLQEVGIGQEFQVLRPERGLEPRPALGERRLKELADPGEEVPRREELEVRFGDAR